MTAQPAPKTQELIDDINTLVLTHRKPTNAEIERLKKQADSLKIFIKNNIIGWADYYDILGQISGLENQKDDMISKFENAIKLESHNHEIHRNYLSCLHNSGLIELATNQAKLLDSKFSSNDSTSLLFTSYFYLCRFRDALQILNKLEKDNEKLLREDDFISSAVTIFDDANLTDDEAQSLHKLAFGLIKTKNLYFSASKLDIIDDCIFYTIYVDLPVKELTKINSELDGMFAKKFKNMRSDVLIFEYSSINILEKEEAYERIV